MRFSKLNGSPYFTVSLFFQYNILIKLFILSLYTYKYVEFPTAVYLVHFTVLGTTAGAHRLWAHASYKAHIALRAFLALGQTLNCQVRIENIDYFT